MVTSVSSEKVDSFTGSIDIMLLSSSLSYIYIYIYIYIYKMAPDEAKNILEMYGAFLNIIYPQVKGLIQQLEQIKDKIDCPI